MAEIEVDERLARLRTIAVEMNALVQELGPKWIRLAHLRQEAQVIIKEFEGVGTARD
jgi:hypothetical protein